MHSVMTRKSTGIGSDLISVVGAIQYAKKTGRDVIIDWRKSRYLKDPTQNLFPRVFEIPENIGGVGVRVADDDFDDSCLESPLELFSSKTQSFEEYHAEMLRKARPVNHSVIVTRPMHHLPEPCVQRQWLAEIKPTKKVLNAIECFYRTRMKDHQVIGVHIRHGNGEVLGEGRDQFVSHAVDAIVADCIGCLDGVRSPGTRLLVCTDCLELRESFASKTDNVIYYDSRLGNIGGGPIHTSDYDLQGAEDAVVEMWLLARCQNLLYTPSWFSHYGRIMGDFKTEPMNLDSFSTYGTRSITGKRVRKQRGVLGRIFHWLQRPAS